MEGGTGSSKACLVAWGMACFSGGNSALGQAFSEISSTRSALVFFNVRTNCFCHFMAIRCTFTRQQKSSDIGMPVPGEENAWVCQGGFAGKKARICQRFAKMGAKY